MSYSSKDRLVSHPHQSLWQHLSSVDEASAAALKGKVLSPDFFGEQEIEAIRRLLVYFHDFGKATDYFQWRITEVARKENAGLKGLDTAYVKDFARHPDRRTLEAAKDDGDLRGHSLIGAFIVQSPLPDDTSPLQRTMIYEVIARHHGNLKDFDDDVQRGAEHHQRTLVEQWAHFNHDDYRAILKKVGVAYAAELKGLQAAYRSIYFSRVYLELMDNKSLLPYLRTVFLFSLLLSGDKGDMMLRDRKLIGTVARLPADLIDRYKQLAFGEAQPSQMNAWREEAYQRVQENLLANPKAGFYSITLPTGMGKTLTAYNAAVRLQRVDPDCLPRIIYCLPFTSVIDQNAAILEKILASTDIPLTGELAKHHYLADWPDTRGGAGEENNLEYSEKEYLVEGWEYTLTVTTFVQFLETLVSNRNRKLRKFHNLANAVVILDEVQSIPPRYFNLVSDLFEGIHKYLGTRFIFVTATQPFLMRDATAVIELTDPTYVYTRELFERMPRIDLDLSLWLEGPDQLEAQIELFDIAVREETSRSFLFIFNFVKDSRLVFEALAARALPNVEYIYLSSAILPIERKRRIRQIKSSNGLRKVVVSTQVVEAGVDIDLDVVYRAFAPLDSINQSAGRCNRNMKGGATGAVRLFKSIRADKIYAPELLKKTERVLKAKLRETGKTTISEAQFYSLNEAYAVEVRKAVADGSATSKTILNHLYQLRFETAEKAFSLIEQEYITYGVFIDDPDRLPTVTHNDMSLTSREVYDRMVAILHNDELGRWDKKRELRLLRPALLQYVVQFPTKYLPEELREEAENKPFVRLTAEPGKYDYRRCYDLTTGYFEPDDKPTECF
ncbi:CRISPR-associated helicase Cas3' [Neolewinella maritima]|uniref:CRISPR-associated helicase Cas3' n=1 Tax=Neolewinella maritima TaxID=1383882 RepID=UPI001EE8ABBB|nr:CRISPR-associated helicase Cas3' [Neolewinella maritima]